MCVVASAQPAYELGPIKVSADECSGTTEVSLKRRISLGSRRLVRRNLKDNDDDEDKDHDDKEDQFDFRFGTKREQHRRHPTVSERFYGAVLSFDTFGLSKACLARLVLTISEDGGNKGPFPFGPTGTCTAASGCLSVELAPSRSGFEDEETTAGTSLLLDGSSVDVSPDNTQVTIELDSAVLSTALGWERLMIRVLPTTVGEVDGKSYVSVEGAELQLSEDACVLTEVLPGVDNVADVGAAINKYPPAWAVAAGGDPCTLQPELCEWPANGSPSFSGCADYACTGQPVAGNGQVDGGFKFAGFFGPNGQLAIMGIRAQIRTAGAGAVSRDPIPVPSGSSGTGSNLRYGWNYDLFISDAGNDLFPDTVTADLGAGETTYTLSGTSDVAYMVRYTGAGGSVESSLDTLWAYLGTLDNTPYVSPFVLYQASSNLGFGFLQPLAAAAGYNDADGATLTVELIARSRVDDAELARVSINVQNVPGPFESGAECGDHGLTGCLPCSDPEASCA
jgi:hypothetical protein